MHLKQKAAPALVAALLGFSGVIALYGELFGEPSSEKEDATIFADSLAITDSEAVEDTSLAKPSLINEALFHPKRLPPLPPENIDTETLWLARCIFSESKRVEEQELVAWVIRNRVETRYRGKNTYQDVVLDPYQFSAFRPEKEVWDFYTGLGVNSRTPGWQWALRIAHHVRTVDSSVRPFSAKTRHFYSERSLGTALSPAWATGREPIIPDRTFQLDERRFRFFEDVS